MSVTACGQIISRWTDWDRANLVEKCLWLPSAAALKELRETLIWLRIIERRELCDPKKLANITGEFDELIAIFVTSIRTAESRLS